MARLLELTIGGSPTSWTSIGLAETVPSDPPSPAPSADECALADIRVNFVDGSHGLVSWTVEHGSATAMQSVAETTIDGIPTQLVSHRNEMFAKGRNTSTACCGARAVAIDHVVVNTDNLERTSAEFTRVLGTDLRRVRDAGRGVTQGFHVLDNTVIEIVSGPHVTKVGAHVWGFVVVVDDINAATTHLGAHATPPKNAVQPGRLISSLHADLHLGVTVAMMSPR